MSEPRDPNGLDPSLQDAARLLRDLPREAPAASFSQDLVEKVRPVAARRRKVMVGAVVAALVALLAYLLSALSLLSGGAS